METWETCSGALNVIVYSSRQQQVLHVSSAGTTMMRIPVTLVLPLLLPVFRASDHLVYTPTHAMQRPRSISPGAQLVMGLMDICTSAGCRDPGVLLCF